MRPLPISNDLNRNKEPHVRYRTGLEEAGYTLPAVGKPLAAYVPTMRDGDNIYTSGQLPLVDGKLAGLGKVGQTSALKTPITRTCLECTCRHQS